ncbi:putative nuclease HARBI1 [Merluccius polli]|uniref:Nuclease HARBI1 n=1 Tax=Merluccius polli TaxID=89951 RepID=A0AA47MQI9_MERPO|nr:putative nuclease HARBI1 [Merluccius polli]
MDCPFIRNPLDIEAVIIRNALRCERIFRPRLDRNIFSNATAFHPTLIYLNHILRPYITNLTHCGRALTSEQTLCIALRFFANGSFLYNIGDAEHIGKATVCRAVRKVTLALKRLLPVMVVFPGHKPRRNSTGLQVATNVENIYSVILNYESLPNVMGCVDGTQIPITAPVENEADYVNRKSFHSINVQICDAAYIVTNVEAEWPARCMIYQECRLSNRFARGEFDGYLLGDRGYPCQPSLLTPDPEPGPQQRFNVAHCRTRARVEMTIGILKSRFQCLQKLRVTPERACDIILAYAKTSVFCAVHKVAGKIVEKRSHCITLPKPHELEATGAGFAALAQNEAFETCVGAIDGCHIRIKAPAGPASIDYTNRKLFHSIQLQAVCDSGGRFLDTFTGYPGSVHDTRDGGYPCIEQPICLMTPYREPLQSRVQERYNACHSRARSIIE